MKNMIAKTLVTSYINPDMDGTACAFAYAEFLCKKGIDAVCAMTGDMHVEARYVFDTFNITHPSDLKKSDIFDEIVLVDTSHVLGVRDTVDPQKVVEIIDHHKDSDIDKFPNAKKIQIELIGAAATLVAERFIDEKMEISKKAAILLTAGIISNTLNFRANQTHQRDRDALEWLNRTAELPDDFWMELFRIKSDLSGNKLYNEMLHEAAQYSAGEMRFGIVQLEIVGGRELIKKRHEEILNILQKIKKAQELDIIFLSIIALDEEKNYFVTEDQEAKRIVTDILKTSFKDIIAIREGVIMRKEIVPLVKEVLNK